MVFTGVKVMKYGIPLFEPCSDFGACPYGWERWSRVRGMFEEEVALVVADTIRKVEEELEEQVICANFVAVLLSKLR
eukprot:4885035-Amphidinium_carterae.1